MAGIFEFYLTNVNVFLIIFNRFDYIIFIFKLIQFPFKFAHHFEPIECKKDNKALGIHSSMHLYTTFSSFVNEMDKYRSDKYLSLLEN